MDRVGIYSCAEIGAKVFEIYFFSIFQMATGHHVELLKVQNFI